MKQRLFYFLAASLFLLVCGCSSEKSGGGSGGGSFDPPEDNTGDTVLTAPSNLVATAGVYEVSLNWTSVSGVTGYKIFQGNSSGVSTSGTPLATTDKTSYTSTGLSAGTTYFFKIIAFNESGNGPASAEVSAIPILAAPTDLIAISGVEQISLNWTSVSEATGYKVFQGNSSGVSTSGTPLATTDKTSYTSTGLSAGVSYYYKVVASIETQNGEASAEANAVALAPWSGILQLGTSGNDKVAGITTDSLGNVYVTGYTDGSFDNKSNVGETDIFVMKFNSSGIKQWTQQFGTSANDEGIGIATDSSGNIFVTGSTEGGMDGHSNAGKTDIFVMKFNSLGIKQWTQQIGKDSRDKGMGIATDSLGNVYVTGYEFGPLTSVFVLKYDTFGNQQWKKYPAGTKADNVYTGASYGHAIAVDSSGNIFITGHTENVFDGHNPVSTQLPEKADIFLVKYNSSGSKLWSLLTGTYGLDYSVGITTDSSGNVFVTGKSFGDMIGGNDWTSGSSRLYVLKYDSSGVKQWISEIKTTYGNQVSYGIATNASGDLFVTGSIEGGVIVDSSTKNAGGYDIIVLKYNSVGTKVWSRSLGTRENDYGFGIAIDASGDVFVTGSTEGGLSGNVNAGGQDIFLMKYDSKGNLQ